MRNNEVYGDMTAWIAAHAGDNESDLMRLKRNLRLAREEELTARQRELLREFEELSRKDAANQTPRAKGWMDKVRTFFAE
jgi:DnaJ-class molecular chaperone